MLSESGFSVTSGQATEHGMPEDHEKQLSSTCRTISTTSTAFDQNENSNSETFFDKKKLLDQTKSYIHDSLAPHGLDWQDELKSEKEVLKSKISELTSTIDNFHKKLDHLYSEASDLTDSYEKQSVSIESDLDTKTVFQSILDQRLSEEDLVTTLAFIRKFFNLICQNVEIEYENSQNFDSDGEKISLKQLCLNLETRKSTASSIETNVNSQVLPENCTDRDPDRDCRSRSRSRSSSRNQGRDRNSHSTSFNRANYSENLNLIKIHKLRRISTTLSLAYDRVAQDLGFDNSGSKTSYLLELVKFYYNFSGDRITKTDQLKDTVDQAEVTKFVSHLHGSVQDTRLLKALVDCINVVKRRIGA